MRGSAASPDIGLAGVACRATWHHSYPTRNAAVNDQFSRMALGMSAGIAIGGAVAAFFAPRSGK
jgi:hypothetical protein